MELRGRAVDIKKYDQQGYICISGVKKHNQYKYENGGILLISKTKSIK